MSSRGDTVFADTVATASAPVTGFVPTNAILSATGIISLYDPEPRVAISNFPFVFRGFAAVANQLSGQFLSGYVVNPSPVSGPGSKGFLVCGINIGSFSKVPTITWSPATAAAGVVANLYGMYGLAELDADLGDGTYKFSLYVGVSTWPTVDASFAGPSNPLEFVFHITG